MKNILFLVFILVNGLTTRSQNIIRVDINKSVLTWTGHAQVGTYSPVGTLLLKSGVIKFNNGQILSADLIIDMSTLHQDNKQLTEHLKSGDFFAVDKFPVSSVNITRVANNTAYGLLTIKEKTLPVSFPVTIEKYNGQIVITGKTSIDRTKFGVIYNSTSFFSNLGDYAISNTFEIEFKVVAK